MTLANGLWALYIAITPLGSVYHCPLGGCPPGLLLYPALLLVAGAITVLVSLISFAGFRVAFIAGSVLSGAIVALSLFWWATDGTSNPLASAAIAAVSTAVDAVASRTARGLAERDSPLNLPVFG